MFYLYELLIRINTLHIDRSFDDRHLLTDVNYFPAYMASRLNCGVSCLNSTIELLDMLIAAKRLTTNVKRQLECQAIEALNCFPSVIPFGGHTSTS